MNWKYHKIVRVDTLKEFHEMLHKFELRYGKEKEVLNIKYGYPKDHSPEFFEANEEYKKRFEILRHKYRSQPYSYQSPFIRNLPPHFTYFLTIYEYLFFTDYMYCFEKIKNTLEKAYIVDDYIYNPVNLHTHHLIHKAKYHSAFSSEQLSERLEAHLSSIKNNQEAIRKALNLTRWKPYTLYRFIATYTNDLRREVIRKAYS